MSYKNESKNLSWYSDLCDATGVAAVPLITLPLSERYKDAPQQVRMNGTRLPNGSNSTGIPVSLYHVQQRGLRELIPGVRNPQSLGPCKVPEEPILTAGISSCAMGTNRCLIASLITSRYRVRVSQNNAVCKFGIENFFTLSLQTLEVANRAIRDMRHKHTSVSLPLHAYQLKQPLLLKG